MAKKNPPRHTREEWLTRALHVLSREGGAKLRVRDLARSLGVTTGSFYWHFNGREDLVQALLDHWDRVYTEKLIEDIASLESTASDRLLTLMRRLLGEGASRYDSAFRSWAAQESEVAAAVEKVDARRWEYASSLFRELGFEGDELTMRVRLFLVYEGNQFDFLDGMPEEEMAKLVELRHALLTRR